MYKFALLGDKVDYSRSPEIFRAMFSCAEVEGSFDIVNCSTSEIQKNISRLRDSGYLALSVTIPHKHSIIEFLDEIDTVAEALVSVNSIRLDSSKIVGFNTDVYGFRQELEQYGAQLKGSRAIILGAGGAARSAAYALALEFEVADITFVGRSPARVTKAVEALSRIFQHVSFRSVTLDTLQSVAEDYEIIVNATPLGGPNIRVASESPLFALLESGNIYYDLNYNSDNELISKARQLELVTIHGLPMLIHQALRSFYLWSGIQVEYQAVAQKVGA
ncbi:hypothetical protein JYT16_02025 [Gemmatimonas aurantiaca]|nr:hypothetical protein [Gemmatimonas aurantiaca]